MKRPPKKSNNDFNDYEESNYNRNKHITLSKTARGIETMARIRTREWRRPKLRRKTLKESIVRSNYDVDLAELHTDQEQGRKEHQDGTGVLVGDKGSLAPDGVEVGGQEDN